MAEALARVCRGRGVEVEVHASVGRALAAVCERKPVAILSGLHLPGLPGTSLVAALKSARGYRAIPVALISSDAEAALVCPGAAADAVIPKTRALREAVAAFLDSIGLVERSDPAADPLPAGRALEGRRILVAEDAAVLQKLVRHLLHVAGADVVVVENGQEAVDAVQGARFDLVLMDVEMPVLDGCRATEALRRLGLKLPILALTGHASAQFREEALACGFDAVLVKPVPKRVLLEACGRFATGSA
jgi:CheY-like chemotaxis protein